MDAPGEGAEPGEEAVADGAGVEEPGLVADGGVADGGVVAEDRVADAAADGPGDADAAGEGPEDGGPPAIPGGRTGPGATCIPGRARWSPSRITVSPCFNPPAMIASAGVDWPS